MAGEGGQQVEAALLGRHVFAQDETEAGLHEGGAHVHKLLSDCGQRQRSHGQVSFLDGAETSGGSLGVNILGFSARRLLLTLRNNTKTIQIFSFFQL